MNGYIKRSAWIAAALLVWSMIALPAEAVSFDCAKAATKVEKLICADAALSKFDEKLNTAYKAALQDEKQADYIRQAQKQWLKGRNGCRDVDCLKASYQDRINELADASMLWEVPSQLKIVKGKGVETCEIYQKNLDALGNPDLSCVRKISQEYEGIIKLPEWRKLDLWENRNLWAQVEKMSAGGVNNPKRMESKNSAWDNQQEIDNLAKKYQKNAEQYHEEVYEMSVADVDINNDGNPELVLRHQGGLCGEPVHYKAIALFVLAEKGGVVDIQKSRPLFQDAWHNPWTKTLEQSGTFKNGSMYDVFIYKGATYFDKWDRSGVGIYKYLGEETEEICHFNRAGR